jgi:outer membrane protein assembly factor BamB
MNGNTIWSTYTGAELYVSPSYADGKIYMVTSQRDLFILDTMNNGAKIATAITPSSSWSSPTIANERLYVGCNDWNVYCFSNFITNQASTSTQSDNSKLGSSLVAVIVTIAAVLVVAILVFGYVFMKRAKK